jgi:hypothetical protein
LLYVPAFFLVALAVPLFLRNELAKIIPSFSRVPVTESLLGFFYGISMVQFVVALVTSGLLLVRTYLTAKATIVRQQVKWVVWGTALAVAPFTLLYAVVYLLGATTDRWLNDVALLCHSR